MELADVLDSKSGVPYTAITLKPFDIIGFRNF